MSSQQVPDDGEKAARRKRAYRLLMLLPLAVTAVLLLPLAFLHRTSEVEISVSASRMSFLAGEPPANGIFCSIPVRSLTLQGFGEVALRSGRIQAIRSADDRDWHAFSPRSPLPITARNPTASLTLHDVTLDSLSFPGRTSLTFSTDRRDPKFVAVRVTGGGASGSISGGKELDLLCDGCRIAGLPSADADQFGALRLRSARPQVIDFKGRAEGIAIGFEAGGYGDTVEQRIPVAGEISFTAFEPGRQISTISTGKLRLPEFGARTVELSSGDFLVVAGLHGFEVKLLRFDNGMQTVLTGRAETLASGPAGYVRNRLPSWLDWIQTRQSWSLYVGALVMVGTTFFAVVRLLKTVREGEAKCDHESS